MSADTTLILLHGSAGTGEAEAMVARARLAAAGVTAGAARAGGFARVLLATDDGSIEDGYGYEVDHDEPGAGFSLRERVLGLVETARPQAVAVMGAGALPFLTAEDFAAVREALGGGGNVAVTNNFYSADLTGWSPGDALARVGPVERDNVLPRRLRDEAGCEVTVLPRSVRTTFDLDTPAELAVLSLSEETPAAIREALPAAPVLPLAPYRALMPLLCDPDAEILVAGRVGSATWAHLERETACRVRVVSEERGMATAAEGHAPRSLVGRLLEEVGMERFADELASLADGAVLDTRVLMAHAGSRASREDRFQSDLLAAERVSDPWLRDLTAALAGAEVPVLAGGHSLLSGGVMALAEQAWLENDRRPGLAPPG